MIASLVVRTSVCVSFVWRRKLSKWGFCWGFQIGLANDIHFCIYVCVVAVEFSLVFRSPFIPRVRSLIVLRAHNYRVLVVKAAF